MRATPAPTSERITQLANTMAPGRVLSISSGLPETDELAAKQAALLRAAPSFLDLDVIEDQA